MKQLGLPIEDSLPELCRVLRSSNQAVLQAPPGSGKSTVVPLVLLEEEWLRGKKILLLQPRRVAAKSIGARMAELVNEALGETVGYRIRFESNISPRTRIEVLTEGILTRQIQGDPGLEGIGLIIFDEFHERSIHADLALALALDVQEKLRPDLRILIMSATIDAKRVSDFLQGAEIITGSGVPFPVEVKYLPEDSKERIEPVTAREVLRAEREEDGDILVFLPGVAEIQRTSEAVQGLAARSEVVELYGDQDYTKQKRALLPHPNGRRKIILSTPIAETSLTIEGVRIVIDSGLMKHAVFDPSYGTNRIETERISADSADQRAGRAGRLGPGTCRRLWSLHTQHTLRKTRTPEILESDLSSLVLELAAWGVRNPAELRWLDLPRVDDWKQAAELLRVLGALNEEGKITVLGGSLARIPAPVRLGAMLVRAKERGLIDEACDLAALLDERDIFRRDSGRGAGLDERLHTLRVFRRSKNAQGADKFQCARVDRVAREWARRFKIDLSGKDVDDGIAGLLLSFAYPERIGKERDDGAGRYILANGGGARLPAEDPLSRSEYIVAAHLNVRTGDNLIFLGAVVDPAQLKQTHSERISAEERILWDEATESVRGELVEALGAVVFSRKSFSPSREQTLPILTEELKRAGGVSQARWEEDDRQLQARAKWARRAFPEKEFPDLSHESLNSDLENCLVPLLPNGRSMKEVREIPGGDVLRNTLTWQQKEFLESELPSHLTGPDSKRRKIDYENDDSPVLAATVQELFGWRETPVIAKGRIPLTLHILSPGRRPIQVTQDLKGFWERTYQDVRKELRGRYPRQQWPEDPAEGVPGGKRRMREKK